MLLVSPARINDVEDLQPVMTKLFTCNAKHIVAQHATVIVDLGDRDINNNNKLKDSMYKV